MSEVSKVPKVLPKVGATFSAKLGNIPETCTLAFITLPFSSINSWPFISGGRILQRVNYEGE